MGRPFGCCGCTSQNPQVRGTSSCGCECHSGTHCGAHAQDGCGHHDVRQSPCLPEGACSGCSQGCSSCRGNFGQNYPYKGANICRPLDEACHDKYLKCAVKFVMTCQASGVSFSPSMCGCPPDIRDIEGWVRRRGQGRWLLKYPAWDTDADGNIQFRFDSQFKSLKPGRYEFQIRVKEHGTHGVCGPKHRPCGSAEITLKQSCPLDLSKHQLVKKAATVSPARPTGVPPVFDAIQNYTAPLCALMDRGDTVLRVSGSGLSQLCGVALCKPVQLVITDGFNTETVTFTGCQNGAAIVVRGAPQFKFPKNATVAFQWTAANVAAAVSGCP
jgi:hypothetical protein